jgi:hypothetical protein
LSKASQPATTAVEKYLGLYGKRGILNIRMATDRTVEPPVDNTFVLTLNWAEQEDLYEGMPVVRTILNKAGAGVYLITLTNRVPNREDSTIEAAVQKLDPVTGELRPEVDLGWVTLPHPEGSARGRTPPESTVRRPSSKSSASVSAPPTGKDNFFLCDLHTFIMIYTPYLRRAIPRGR